MSLRVRMLRQKLERVREQLTTTARRDFPRGRRISVIRNGHNRIGTIEGHFGCGEAFALRVRMERTNELLDVGLWEEPELLPQ